MLYMYIVWCLSTVILEIFTLRIFACLIFVVIHYSWFQEAVNIHCSKNEFKKKFWVLIFVVFQSWIINNREKFQNYVKCTIHHQIFQVYVFAFLLDCSWSTEIWSYEFSFVKNVIWFPPRTKLLLWNTLKLRNP